MLTQTHLKKILHYNPKTGVFTWKITTGSVKTNKITGCPNGSNYLVIRINNKKYFSHRLAWMYTYGYFPEHSVDHKNGIRHDNRLSNLREVTHACNMQNSKLSSANKSGFTGVSPRKNRWLSQIMIQNKGIFLGYHKDKISAALARVTFEDQCDQWSCDYQSLNRVRLRELGYKV